MPRFVKEIGYAHKSTHCIYSSVPIRKSGIGYVVEHRLDIEGPFSSHEVTKTDASLWREFNGLPNVRLGHVFVRIIYDYSGADLYIGRPFWA